MNKIEKDIMGTYDVYNTRYSSEYNKVYFNTNESLDDLFKNVDIKNKDVLTVLGSGDQSFYCYDGDARSVDVFDVNRLAIYYYYLRIWTIEYFDRFYPKDNLDKEYISNLLKLVTPNNEKEWDAFNYWKSFVRKSFIDLRRFFYAVDYFKINNMDLEKIKRRLEKRDFNVYNIDISKPWSNHKRYDVIVTSNISDYVPKTVDSFICYRDSLNSLLKDDGIVLCSRIGHSISSCERDTFKDIFKRKSFPKVWICGKLESPGYSYKKR